MRDTTRDSSRLEDLERAGIVQTLGAVASRGGRRPLLIGLRDDSFAQLGVEIGPPLSDEQRLEMAVRYLGEDLGRRYVERTAGSDSITISGAGRA